MTELARLYRYSFEMPDDTVCIFYPEFNLLQINADLWETLDDITRHELMTRPRTLKVVVDIPDDVCEAA